MNLKSSLKFLYQHLKGSIKGVVLCFFLMLVSTLLILPAPLITKFIIDDALPEKDIVLLFRYLSLSLFILITIMITAFFQTRVMFKINNSIIVNIKRKLLKKLSKVTFRTLETFDNGYIFSRVNNDTEQLRSVLANGVITVIESLLTVLISSVFLFFINVRLAIVAMLIIPAYVLTNIYFSRLVRKQAGLVYEAYARTTQQLDNSLNINILCRLFGKPLYPVYHYFRFLKEEFRTAYNMTKLISWSNLVIGFIYGLFPLIIIGYGVFLVMQSKMTIGDLFAFEALTGYIFSPIDKLSNSNIQFQQAVVAISRINEILHLPEEVKEKDERIDGIKRLRCENIHFSYDDEPLLKDFSIEINRSEKIALIGESGCGKTTFIRILMGLLESSSGKYIVNDYEISANSLKGLRCKVALVEQEPILINDTILNNITFGARSFNQHEFEKVLEQAAIKEFVESLPDKEHTVIDNNGGNLSVGQKQRIAIARALFKKPDLLILDEATSNIDSISEMKFTETLSNLPDNVMVLVIAHRLNTIKKCDYINIMENGRIVERGSHEILKETSDKYREMIQNSI